MCQLETHTVAVEPQFVYVLWYECGGCDWTGREPSWSDSGTVYYPVCPECCKKL